MRSRPRFFGGLRAATAAATMIAASGAHVARADCQPPTHQSTCFDADELWTPAAPSSFVGIAPGRALEAHAWSIGLDTTYLSRPVVLQTGSPDPGGRDVRVVDDVVDVTMAAAYSPVRHLELSAIVPTALYRSGTGLAYVTSQSGPELPAAALRDIRLGAAHDLWQTAPGARGYDASLATRLVLALPPGKSDSFAGERGPVLAPTLSLDLRGGSTGSRHDLVFAAAEVGARLRRPVAIGGARLGTELVSTLGIGVNTLDEERLAIALEGWMFLTPLSQERTLPDGTLVTNGTLAPSEWMLSARTRAGDLTISLGIGTAVPLSAESRRATDGQEATTHFAAITSPRFRGALVIRYAPGSAPRAD